MAKANVKEELVNTQGRPYEGEEQVETKAAPNVKYFLRRPAGEYETNGRVVGVNGVMYTVPYDKEVEVPPAVADILNRSQEAARAKHMAERRLQAQASETEDIG